MSGSGVHYRLIFKTMGTPRFATELHLSLGLLRITRTRPIVTRPKVMHLSSNCVGRANGRFLAYNRKIINEAPVCCLCKCQTNFLTDLGPPTLLPLPSSKNARHYSDDKNGRNGGGNKNVTSLFIPVPVKPANNPDDINIGEELGGSLKNKKEEILGILNKFVQREPVRRLAEENGLDDSLFQQAFSSFRNMIIETDALEVDLHLILSDILVGAGHVDDIFPYFLSHARQVFPALDCMDDLRKISDLTDPSQWYSHARSIKRKVIFHAGPTNSGKTYHALERYSQAQTGVYCGPLKLLANEVEQKTSAKGIACDLVTGEERKMADPEGLPSGHVACTVEMTSVITPYEVAVIDEIQMLRDPQRGWAWTRALLGVAAKEVHLCGEEAAYQLVKELLKGTGDTLEIRKYKRLTKLTILDYALDSLENVRAGDCIVVFSKKDIYELSRKLEDMGKECAVIYGGLPPGAKLKQASKFNDPEDPCKILIATDAIGMGLNLSIKRVIFYSLKHPFVNERGELDTKNITTSQALQIAGRAGRFGTQFQDGEATTFYERDLSILKEILAEKVENIQAAGLHPTAEQIELFAYHLPDSSISNIIDIFVNLCKVENNFFVCDLEDFKFLADMIQHIPLYLRARYVFCSAPINKKIPFLCATFLRFARMVSRNEPITFDFVCRHVGWPIPVPKSISDLAHIETIHDVMDLYLWLSYRFMDMFPDRALVREIQGELDVIIHQGVLKITKLLLAGNTKATPFLSSEDAQKNLAAGGRRGPRRDTKDQYSQDSYGIVGNILDRKGGNDYGMEPGRGGQNFSRQSNSSRKGKQEHRSRRKKGLDRVENLSEMLVKEGIVSKDIMEQLKRELLSSENGKDKSDDSNDDSDE